MIKRTDKKENKIPYKRMGNIVIETYCKPFFYLYFIWRDTIQYDVKYKYIIKEMRK